MTDYVLSCPKCNSQLAYLSEEQFYSEAYLQGDEPLWCETCEHEETFWRRPSVSAIASESTAKTVWQELALLAGEAMMQKRDK